MPIPGGVQPHDDHSRRRERGVHDRFAIRVGIQDCTPAISPLVLLADVRDHELDTGRIPRFHAVPVFRCISVPYWAMSSVLRFAPPHVLRVGNRFQVVWPHTPSIAAEVVNFQARWYWTDENLVSDARSALGSTT